MEFEGRSPIRMQLSIAPLLDVVLLLLIFFLLTSSYSSPQAIDLLLPISKSAKTEPSAAIVVLLKADGVVRIAGNTVSRSQITPTLASMLAGDADKAVTLKTDATVSVQSMLEVLDALRRAGASEIRLATRPPPS